MCGRYVLTTPFDVVASLLRVAMGPSELPLFPPRYNIAPSQSVPIVRRAAGKGPGVDTGNELAVVRWGFVPRWSKGEGDGPPPPINARSETADSKQMFREAFAQRRCLVPADGFYEWKSAAAGAKHKQPYLVTAGSGLFAMAGLWERWTPKDGAGESIETCVILTTLPNPFLASLHDRMPAILPRNEWERWLDPSTDVATAKAMLRPLGGEEELSMRPVSRRVNSPRNDDAACMEPPGKDDVEPGAAKGKAKRATKGEEPPTLFGGKG